MTFSSQLVDGLIRDSVLIRSKEEGVKMNALGGVISFGVRT